MDAVQRLSPNMDVRFNIIPKVTVTDEHLKSREIHRRRCLFAHESNLKYFKHYTQNNCRLECISKQSRKVCKCTKFWIPSNSSTTNVCGEGFMRIMKTYETELTFLANRKWNRLSGELLDAWYHASHLR